ncbi:MAG: hypothetical protein GXP59_09170, partial [Deltaproteobacteria bacterium]|nr:hypothetical protein [Deltaproteobacteria bacterium]
MGQKRQSIKRPCRICRKWFIPNPRLGERQMTCGAAECQKQWHKRKCADWNRKNCVYFRENYLRKRLQIAASAQSAQSAPQSSLSTPSLEPVAPLGYPREVVQEVIGAQPLVIVEEERRRKKKEERRRVASQLSTIDSISPS